MLNLLFVILLQLGFALADCCGGNIELLWETFVVILFQLFLIPKKKRYHVLFATEQLHASRHNQSSAIISTYNIKEYKLTITKMSKKKKKRVSYDLVSKTMRILIITVIRKIKKMLGNDCSTVFQVVESTPCKEIINNCGDWWW